VWRASSLHGQRCASLIIKKNLNKNWIASDLEKLLNMEKKAFGEGDRELSRTVQQLREKIRKSKKV